MSIRKNIARVEARIFFNTIRIPFEKTISGFAILFAAITIFIIANGSTSTAKEIKQSVCDEYIPKSEENAECVLFRYGEALINQDRVVVDATSEQLSPPSCRNVSLCHIGTEISSQLDSGVNINSILKASDQDLSRVRNYVGNLAPRAEVVLVTWPGRLIKECRRGGALIVSRFYYNDKNFYAYIDQIENSPMENNEFTPFGCRLAGVLLLKRTVPMEEDNGE